MAIRGVNQVIIVGHLGAAPDLSTTPGGKSVCTLNVATSEVWKDHNGAQQELVDWHRIVIWGKRASIAAQFLAKGDPVYIRGKNRTRPYQDKHGVDKQITEIIVDQSGDMQLIGSKTRPTQSV